MATFKELNEKAGVRKKITKHGDILGINFTKEEIIKFGLRHSDLIVLDNAEIIRVEDFEDECEDEDEYKDEKAINLINLQK